MEILLSSIAAGLLFGMVLAMVALGLTIIFGVMDIVNFAHGEFLMIGMYTGLLTAQATGIDPLLTLPAAAAVGFVLGIICYSGFVRFLLRGPMIAQLLGTFGLMLLLRNLALLIFGSEDRALHHGLLVGKSFDIGMGIIIPATKLAAAGLSIVAFGGGLAAHEPHQDRQGPDCYFIKCPGRALHGNPYPEDECPGLGHRRRHGDHRRCIDC